MSAMVTLAPPGSGKTAMPTTTTELLPPEPPPLPPLPSQALSRLEPDPSEAAIAKASILTQIGGNPPDMAALRRGLRPLRAQRAARAAWLAPVVAVLLACASHWGRELHASAPSIIAAVNAVLLVVGLVCGVAALVAIRRPDRPGIAGPAVVGICISMMLAVFGVAVAIAYQQILHKEFLPQLAAMISPAAAGSSSPEAAPAPAPAAASAPTPKPQAAAQPRGGTPQASRQPSAAAAVSSKQSVRDEPARRGNWYGVATAGGATLRITEQPADAGSTQRLLAKFGVQVTVLTIAIDNTRGSAQMSIDPSSLRAESADGRKYNALPTRAVLETAMTRDRDGLMARYGKDVRADPGQVAAIGMSFFMSGTSFQNVNRMTLMLNGRRVAMTGRFVPNDNRVAVLQNGGAAAAAAAAAAN